MKIDINSIVDLTEDEVFDRLAGLPNSPIDVICCDGEVTTTPRRVIFSWCVFALNRVWRVPVHSRQILTIDELPTDKGSSRLMNDSLKLVYEYLNKKVPLNRISKTGLDVMNAFTNAAIRKLERYSATIDAEDYYELLSTPEVSKIKSDLKINVESSYTSDTKFKHIKSAFTGVDEFIEDHKFSTLKDNGLVQLVVSETCKGTQFSQGIVARGFVTEVNSDFYATPVTNSFSEGLSTPYEYSVETRSGTKAAMYQTDPMEDTEYLHRLVQMVAASFQNLHLGDCGSTVTYPFQIRKDTLPLMVGKFYLDGPTLKEITKDDKHLIGKVINVRGVSGCKIEDEVGCCSTCAGTTSLSMAEGVNVGHTASTVVMGTGSQKVLSVKHDDLSVLGNVYRVPYPLNNVLTVAGNKREVVLKDSNKYTIAFKSKMAPYISDIRSTSSVELLDITKVSNITQILIHDNSDDLSPPMTGSLTEDDKGVSLSSSFLKFIKDNPDKLDLRRYKHNTYYFIDLSDFNKDDSLFVVPFKHFDMLDQHKITKRFIESPLKDDGGSKLTDYSTFGEAANAVMELTKDKLKINMTNLELMIYAFTIRSSAAGDYRLARGSNSVEFASMRTLFDNRSLSPKLSSQEQGDVIYNPSIMVERKGISHPYDQLYYKVG